MNKIIYLLSFILGITVTLICLAYIFLGPVSQSKQISVFVIPQEQESFDVVKELKSQNLIRSEKAFRLLKSNFFKDANIESGGYRLNQNMDSWQILTKLSEKPDLFWLTISYCLRKEQIGEILAETLGWNEKDLAKWNSLYNNSKSEYFEGVYYPDTYLLPTDEPPDKIAQRFINNFNENFSPLADDFINKNIKWTTGVKIASLIAREAAGKQDMGLISGIIWNRLEQDMPLQIDATLQYVQGKNSNGSWWGNIDTSKKQSDSPYNTYKYRGLPPTAICSPNIDAIEAALNPEETDCLYYLHDTIGQIHCAKTYQQHLQNIDKYLK